MEAWPTSPVDWNQEPVVPFLPLHSRVQFPSFGVVVVQDWLGCGAFGQVYKVCQVSGRTTTFYAMKVSPSTMSPVARQIRREIDVYNYIAQYFTDAGRAGCGQMHDCQLLGGLIYILLDYYPRSLLSVLQDEAFRGYSVRQIQKFLSILIHPIFDFWESDMIHTDIKPENIMLSEDNGVKLIDFGGTAFRDSQLGAYIQSRWYRAPELILAEQPTAAIDIWSLGATIAEMYIGVPIFAGQDQLNVLQLIELRLGQFPQAVVDRSSRSLQYFRGGRVRNDGEGVADGMSLVPLSLDRLLRAKEFPDDPPDLRGHFFELLTLMLQIDPDERITPREILDHPFLVGADAQD
jgi:serine/threonine protein kinase